MIDRTAKNSSFSLVEVLLAMTILGIAVSSILTTFSTALIVGKLSEDYSVASALMEELNSYVRTNQFSPYETNSGNFTSHPEFQWTVSYFYTDLPDLYQVDMNIMWKRGSRERTLTHTTYQYFKQSEDTDTDQSQGGGQNQNGSQSQSGGQSRS